MPLSTLTQVITGNKLFTLHQRVVVGVSGGPDSMALLLLLAESDLALDCIAAYIDHGLRPQETEAERLAVERLALDCRAGFCCRTVPVREHAAALGLSLEDAARTLRYQALENIREECGAEVIAVAHTADDQVEEFLLRMIRGCGRNGLTGMLRRQGRVVRPLLGLRKQELTDYLAERRISFCVDSSNLDRRFLRNRIRLDLLPMLERQFNPSIRRTILQTMDILGEEEDLLGRMTEKALPPLPGTSANHLTLPLASLDARHPALRRRMIEQGCWAMDARPTFRQINLVLSLLDREGAGAEVHLSCGLRVQKTKDALMFYYPRGKKAFRGNGSEVAAVDMEIAAPGEYPLPALGALLVINLGRPPVTLRETPGLVVDADRISFPLHLHSIAPGQRFRPFGGKGSKKINRFLNDRGIPASQRDSCLVLSMGDEVVALPGLAIDDRFRVSETTRTVVIIDWQIDRNNGRSV